MKTDKPTPPDGYESLTWEQMPDTIPQGIKYLNPSKGVWVTSGSLGLHKSVVIPGWYAVPVKPDEPPPTLDTQVGGTHCKDMAIQPIEFCTKNRLGFAEGLAVKYICRHEQKNGAQDLDKAIHCLQLLRELRYGKPS